MIMTTQFLVCAEHIMRLVRHNYLSERMLRGLLTYKYTASGHTWLDRLHDPLWNWIVENLFPTTLAPNLITLSGLICMIAAHILLAAFAPDLDGNNAPAWVHLFACIALVMYVNLDCMDGKQARRTKSSSPLGQLFDHGCDALVTGLIFINVGTSVVMPVSPRMVLMMFAPLMLWILGQWEEYHTGALSQVAVFILLLSKLFILLLTKQVQHICSVLMQWDRPLRPLIYLD
jgi:ethanolaminephosphotransferase